MYNKILTKDVAQDAVGKILRKMLHKILRKKPAAKGFCLTKYLASHLSLESCLRHLDNIIVHQNTPVKKHFFPMK